MPDHDPVNHPSHYTSGPIEVIDIIEGFGLGFALGNSIKYILRSPHKGAELEDLKKARWYLDREIARMEEVAVNVEAQEPTHVGYWEACEADETQTANGYRGFFVRWSKPRLDGSYVIAETYTTCGYTLSECEAYAANRARHFNAMGMKPRPKQEPAASESTNPVVT